MDMEDIIPRNSSDPIANPTVQSVFSIIYTVIFVLGMFGNLLTCFVVFRNRDMQTVTNFFITNLALSDILLCTLSVPFTPLYAFSGQWVFGSVMCYMVSFAQGVSVYVSTLTLTSIAVDRFFVIIYPFRRRMKISTCFFIICMTWLFSVLAITPYVVHIRHKMADTGEYFCEEVWSHSDYRKSYGIVTITLQFILPFIIIASCYIIISIKLSDQTRCRPGVSNPRREEVERSRKQRTNRMLIAMVFIFGLCWLPLNIMNITNDLSDDDEEKWEWENFCFSIVHTVAMSSTCYNPFLYSWLNENFRKEFKQVLPGCHRHSRPAEQTRNGNDTVQDSLLTSLSVVRRSSSARDRRCEKIVDIVKVKYNAEEEKVNLSEIIDSNNIADDSCKSPPSVASKPDVVASGFIKGGEPVNLV